MIAIKLQGRLGNQLFQYAFAHVTAKQLGTQFYLDTSIEVFLLPQYFKIPSSKFYYINKYIFSIKGFKNIFSHHLKVLFYNLIRIYYNLEDLHFSNFNLPYAELKKVQNQKLYQGFFQSEIYFEECKNTIKQLFIVKDLYISSYQKIINSLPKSKLYIVVHIRKGDYMRLGLDLPISYFHKAINEIEAPNAFYIFLSDEPDSIQIEFDYIPHKYISRNSEIIDLQFLMNADICVLSNSSFSWWGAYLNTIKNKTIIAPSKWCGKNNIEFPIGISNNLNWTWIEPQL